MRAFYNHHNNSFRNWKNKLSFLEKTLATATWVVTFFKPVPSPKSEFHIFEGLYCRKSRQAFP